VSLFDRYGLQPVLWVALELLVFLGLLAYGLAPPSLGTHLVGPAVAMLGAYAVLAWITLYRPWSGSLDHLAVPVETARRWPLGRDQALLGTVLSVLAGCHYGLIESAKEQIVELQRVPQSAMELLNHDVLSRSWADDRWGWLLVSDMGAVRAIWIPVAMLVLLWIFLG